MPTANQSPHDKQSVFIFWRRDTNHMKVNGAGQTEKKQSIESVLSDTFVHDFGDRSQGY